MAFFVLFSSLFSDKEVPTEEDNLACRIKIYL